ncbi:MAG TPA: mannose-6-phosphate isomerase, class I, partial [Microbacterium sp.]|nr:mannose-6-phosphate isomerase, class I [Microbacterium sp.]
MLVPLTNTPRDYAWGSTTLIAELEGRTPTGAPEAEVWFGDHPGHPARVPDGRTLGEWLAS